jgi:hypothetical protein
MRKGFPCALAKTDLLNSSDIEQTISGRFNDESVPAGFSGDRPRDGQLS